jgi:hypothetical protein
MIIMKTILPVDFPVVVNGKRMGANLVQIENHVMHHVFIICFADGYEDGFYDYEDDCVRGVNEKQSQPYARALSDELWLFNLIDSATMSVKHFLWEADGIETNAWLFTKQREESELYTVYLKGNYRFDIWEKAGSWIINCSNRLHPIDRLLAEQAVALIGKVPALPQHSMPPKEIEFPFSFNYLGKQINAMGMLVPTAPFPQYHIAIKTDLPTPHLDMYQFFKIDSKEQIFCWNPCPAEKEPIARAIAKALEKKFKGNMFSEN